MVDITKKHGKISTFISVERPQFFSKCTYLDYLLEVLADKKDFSPFLIIPN